jgi:hypothetical protein
VSIDELKPQIKKKYEPPSPHQPHITPTSYMPTLYHKTDRNYTYFKEYNPSFKIFDPAPAMEKLQQENFQLLQQLEERKTMDMHLHHDNEILQAKVNSIQRLVNEMTKSNCNLKVQLKQQKRNKKKSSRQEGEASKTDSSQQA